MSESETMIGLKRCPFCKESNLKIMTKKIPCGTNGLDDMVFRYRAYVRCTKCNARGPLASGRVMYVNYELPKWAEDPWDINGRAVDGWNRRTGIKPEWSESK